MNSAEQLQDILQKEHPQKIFLVADGAYEKSGAKGKFAPLFDNYEVVPFLDIRENPTIEQVKNGIEAFLKSQADLVVAIGGGSVIDTAKALNLLAAQDGDPVLYVKKEQEIANSGKPLVAIPTTAGTGAEATHVAVVYIDRIKYSISHAFLLPNYAIVDAALTHSLPPRVTAVTGMDALSQAIEAYWSINATDESKEYSKEAIGLILPNLAIAVGSPTPEAREAMAQGAYLSGKAINIAKEIIPTKAPMPNNRFICSIFQKT